MVEISKNLYVSRTVLFFIISNFYIGSFQYYNESKNIFFTTDNKFFLIIIIQFFSRNDVHEAFNNLIQVQKLKRTVQFLEILVFQ